MANIVNGTATGSGGLITTGDSSDELQLQTAETTAVTIDSSQNVGIGTTTPGYFVEASRSQDTVTNLAVTNASTGTAAQTRLRLNNSGSNFGTITHTGGSFTTSGVFRQDGTYVYSNGAGGLTLVTGAAQPIYFAPNSTERVRIDSDGLKFNGDTAAANALDDYEEGTWTGTIAPETGAFGSITYGTQAGSYTKVGNMVTIQMNIYTAGITVGTASGAISITGLPFAEATSGAAGLAVEAGLFGDWVVAPIAGYISGSSIILTKRATANSASSTRSVVGDLNTGAFNNYIIFSCTYLAT